MTLPHRKQRVLIAGGGLAGLTCALRLAERGHHVSVFEALPYLGGRASTYVDRDGDTIEQGLHIFLGAYTEMRALLHDIGQTDEDVLVWMTRLRLQDAADGSEATFGIDPLHAPLEAVRHALTHNDYLAPGAKLSAVPLVVPALTTYEGLRTKHDYESVTDWWKRASGDPQLLERLIRPFCRAVQFTEPEEYSAFNFLGLVRDVVHEPSKLQIAGYRGARGETIFRPLARRLEALGVRITTGQKLTEIALDSDGTIGAFVLEGGERVRADAYVSALPVWTLRPLLPPVLGAQPFFASFASLPVCGAIAVQLFFDRKVVGRPEYTLVANSRAVVYQEQSETAYPSARGRISVDIAPADGLLEQSDEQILELVLGTLRQVQPDVAAASVIKSVILRHPQHLLRPRPGVMSRRPRQRTPVSNFFVAGDWTEQPFFACQEGAVRSGNLCAKAIVEATRPSPRREASHPPR